LHSDLSEHATTSGIVPLGESSGKEPTIYGHRFTPLQQARREQVWQTLCRDFFQALVPLDSTLVDVGAGDGHFVRNIHAARRIAVDVSPHVLPLAQEGIEVIQASATAFASSIGGQADIVFMSNFLEHLPHKNLVLEVLEESARALRKGGRIIILQPNIRHLGAAYWDYIDHHIALTDQCLTEALDVTGFRVTRVVSRFLPYTIKSRAGSFSWLLPLYLRLPWAWRFFGKQSLIIAEKVN